MRGEKALKSGLERRVVDALSGGGRILVSRLQFLGDVILTLPAILAIKQKFPDAKIDYLSRADGAAVLEGDPLFDRVLKIPASGESVMATGRLIAALRQEKYDAAIDLYSNPRSALLTWLSGARMRIGGSRRGRRHLYTHSMTTPPTIRSAIDHHLFHLTPLGITDVSPEKPELTLTPEEKRTARERLGEFGVSLDNGPVVGLHPGGKWEVKRWPADQFVALGKSLADRHGFQLVVLIGPGEDVYQKELRDGLGDRAAYLPTFPIRDTAAIIEALNGLVISDGGIMHVSVAVGTPTVGIFGSAEPDIWFPYEKYGPYRAAYIPIDCRPCHSHECSHISCLRKLTAQMVEGCLIDVLKDIPSGSTDGDRPNSV